MSSDVEMMDVADTGDQLFNFARNKKKVHPTCVPWVEKYRPKRVDEVVSQEEAVSVLKDCLKGGDFPHFLFYGPPGTGKTSTMMALCSEMFKHLYKERVLELNASDDRGIDVIREKVKTFSTFRVAQTTGIPDLRIVILDEADSMTTAAQSALRRVMEASTNTTRFCIICNYVTRIIEPITSRCTKFRFKPLPQNLVIERLRFICDEEKMRLVEENDGEVLETLINVCDGDLRRAVTMLHSLFKGKGGEEGCCIKKGDVTLVSGYIPDEEIEKLCASVKKENVPLVVTAVRDLIALGYSGSQLTAQLLTWGLDKDKNGLSNQQQIGFLKRLAQADFQLLEGACEELQILNLMSWLATSKLRK